MIKTTGILPMFKVAILLTLTMVSACRSVPEMAGLPAGRGHAWITANVSNERAEQLDEEQDNAQLVHATQETQDVQAAVTSAAWWMQFNDPLLLSLLQRALAHHHDIVEASHRIDAARAHWRIERLRQFMPDGTLKLDQPLLRESGYRGNRESGILRTPLSLSASLTQNVDAWGLRAHETDSVGGRLEAQRYQRDEVKRQAVEVVARAYWQIALTQRQVVLAREAHADSLILAELARQRVQAGDEDARAFHSAQRHVSDALGRVSVQEEAVAAARHLLSFLLGDGLNVGKPIPAVLPFENAGMAPLPGRVPASVLDARPDVRAAKWMVRSRLFDVAVSRLRFYPQINLTASSEMASQALSRIIMQPVNSLAAGLLFPLFDLPNRPYRIVHAQAHYAGEAEAFAKTLYTALREVKDALAKRARSATELPARRDDWRAAQQLEALETIRFEGGASPLAAAVKSREARRQAEETWLQARFDAALSVASLGQSLGATLEPALDHSAP